MFQFLIKINRYKLITILSTFLFKTVIFLTFLVYLQILLQNYGTKGSQKGKKAVQLQIFAEEGESNPNPKLSRKYPKNLRLERKSSSNMSKDTGGGYNHMGGFTEGGK